MSGALECFLCGRFFWRQVKLFTFDVKYMTKKHGALLSSHLFVVVFISDTMSRFAAVAEEDGVQIIADKYAKNAEWF